MSSSQSPETIAALRERLDQYLKNELIPFERERGLGYEDQFPKALVRSVWQRW